MTRRVVDLPGPRAPLDIVSYGRSGPPFTPAHHQAIALTITHTPEVVVKVSGGGRSVGHVIAHLRYIGRHGRLPLILDDGEEITSMSDVRAMLADWALETEALEGRRRYSGKPGPSAPRIVYNLVFSMPARTNPKKVLTAVQNFAEEQWGLEHRYAMVLHTDTPRPHVHVVLKAVSEQGQRLYITREVLRGWREQFALHLRALGVPANATSRAVRGRPGHGPVDKVYRALCRSDSQIVQARHSRVKGEIKRSGRFRDQAGTQVRQTRREVENDWKGLQTLTIRAGDTELAEGIGKFMASWPAALTDAEAVAIRLQHEQSAARDRPEHRIR